MHDSSESDQSSFSKFDEIIQSIFTHFPNAKILTPEEAAKFNLGNFKPYMPVNSIKKPERKGAGRATASAGKQGQVQKQGTLFDLHRYGGEE
ncbi:MAG: hypothetical protein JW902_01255 [Syntrophaceae bacterium]|nr:hypothetical protein [Syntrophaceae bacterium]